MAEPTRDERLAALKARRAEASANSEPSSVPASEAVPTSATGPTSSTDDGSSAGLLDVMRRATLTGATRLATAGASIVSFAAMVVAMGPLTGSGDEAATEPAPADDTVPTTIPPPTQPNVVIEVVPNYVSADGSAQPPEQLAATDETANADTSSETLTPRATTQAPASVPTTAPAATVAPTAAPTTAPAATVAPTAAPTTAAPTTAAPTTAAPTTAVPTTAAPAPPRSDASG